MASYLRDRGFELMNDLDAPAYRENYWGAKGKRLRGYEFYHVALAQGI